MGKTTIRQPQLELLFSPASEYSLVSRRSAWPGRFEAIWRLDPLV